MSTWTALAGNLAAEAACVPFGLVVHNEREFSCPNPPFAGERQVSALHLIKSDVFPFTNLCRVFRKPAPQGAPAFCGSFGSFTDVNDLVPEIEDIDAASLRSCGFRQGKERAVFKLLDDLVLYATVEVEIKVVRIVLRH